MASILARLPGPLRRLAALVGTALAASAAAAAEPLPDGLLCRDRIARVERAEGLPPGLLQAIALAESGRFDAERRTLLPWPWTVNAGGESAYLASKEEAIRHVARLRAQGRTNIDVGCLQINLGWHPTAFPDLEAAFDPEANASYAAAFLATLREEGGSWEVAVERYHSRDPDRGQSYRERVWRHWAGRTAPGAPGEAPLLVATARPAPPAAAAQPAAAGQPAQPAAAGQPAQPAPLATVPVRAAAIERAALRSVNRMAARQTWRWLQLQAPMPFEPAAGAPAVLVAALDPAAAEPAAGAVLPVALLPRPFVYAGPARAAPAVPPGRIPGVLGLRPMRAPAAPRRPPAPS